MSKIAILTNDLHELVEKNQERIDAVQASKKDFCDFLQRVRGMVGIVVRLQLVNDPNDPNAERYGDHLPVQKGTRGAKIIEKFLDPSGIVMEKSKENA